MGGFAKKETSLQRDSQTCAQCGRRMFRGDDYWVWSPGAVEFFTASNDLNEYCSKGCCEAANAGKSSGSGSKGGSILGGIAGGIASAAAANKAATEASYERQKAEKKAENQAALDKLRTLSFSGDAQQISAEMEELYQIWISYNPSPVDKLTDNATKTYVKLLEEKLDYGLMSLKSADATKGSYYEEKISKEKAKRKTFGYKLKCIFTN